MTQTYTGKSFYLPDYEEAPHRFLVAVSCSIEDLPNPVYALLDTGSEWCVLPVRVALELGFDLAQPQYAVPLHTRLGTFFGRLERVRVRFDEEEGLGVDVDATCFVSQDWPGPMVIGWRGCLQRVRFGLDPSEDAFYFAAL